MHLRGEIHQDLVEHVDNQERFQEYSYRVVYLAAFQFRSSLIELEVLRA